MDGLITLLMIVVFVAKVFGKSKKKPKKAPQAAPRIEDFISTEGKTESWTVAQPTVRVLLPTESDAERLAKRKAELKARFDGVRQKGNSHEGISRSLQPSEELTAGRPAGSMAYHSDEGMDVCDPSLSHGESSLDMSGIPVFAPHKDEEPLFTADDMVRGFVMSEIFARPGVNRWKR